MQSRIITNDKSNSMIYSTIDQKYIVKTIGKTEKEIFLNILLDSYCKRILQNKQSKLIRILGVFKLLPSKIYILLMEKIAYSLPGTLIFDLKGSEVDRYVTTSNVISDY